MMRWGSCSTGAADTCCGSPATTWIHVSRPKGGRRTSSRRPSWKPSGNSASSQGDSEQELLAWLRHRLRYRAAKFIRSYRLTAKRTAGREIQIDAAGSSSAVGPVLVDGQPSPSERAIAVERDHLLEQAMDRLPDEYRRVIDLRYREGLSFDQIGVILERSPNSARKLWARAIERLKGDLRATSSP